MQFGRVSDPTGIDFTLPEDHIDTKRILDTYGSGPMKLYMGLPRWSKNDVKGFYPKGVKDELVYYSSQFNSIELNATFYTVFKELAIEGWKEKTPSEFKFFPKIYQGVTHLKRLKDSSIYLNPFLDSVAYFEESLGRIFMQLPENFGPTNWLVLKNFIETWPSGFSLAIELRHEDWFNGSWENERLFDLLERYKIAIVMTDVAARRDLLHMRLTTPEVLIRFNAVYKAEIDYKRLDDWVDRIAQWQKMGIGEVSFFVHQEYETSSAILAIYLAEKLRKLNGVTLKVPNFQGQQLSLF